MNVYYFSGQFEYSEINDWYTAEVSAVNYGIFLFHAKTYSYPGRTQSS
jgi:hypothetical protein